MRQEQNLPCNYDSIPGKGSLQFKTFYDRDSIFKSPIRLSKDTNSNIQLYREIGDPHLEEKLSASEARSILQKNKLTSYYYMSD